MQAKACPVPTQGHFGADNHCTAGPDQPVYQF